LLEQSEAGVRFPQIKFEGVRSVIYEFAAGYLAARIACQTVVDSFLADRGLYLRAQAVPGDVRGSRMDGLRLSDGSELKADNYLFACGPWLGRLFPGQIGELIVPTRQEVFFFGTGAGESRFEEGQMPAWVDHGLGFKYGMPGNLERGFKVADDARGPGFDPTDGERVTTIAGLASARDYLRFRFPALKDAPLVDGRVCQYEDTPDHHFIIDRLPGTENVWIAGGGSGHGFKHGPAVGGIGSWYGSGRECAGASVPVFAIRNRICIEAPDSDMIAEAGILEAGAGTSQFWRSAA